MSDATRRALELPGVGSVDDVAKNIGRGLGVFGALAGAAPGIADSIDGGMDPTKAVIVEAAPIAAGAAATYVFGVIGGAAGSVVPGPGTVAGAAVGIALGGLVSYTADKVIERVWR
ncbi:MAG: hypothetical protein U5N21_03750 [Rhodococcus sp. (in: high G+C Gram-positive bacteria)]|nr:hypothetical protein [Rhodococcus sp. (in: high G+C Gram-positive bacteria)]